MARTGMSDLITELRSLTDAAVGDYSIIGAGTVTYWTDDQLQTVLDNHRTDIKFIEMTAEPEGDLTYLDYSVGYGNLEQTAGGTAVFIVQDVNGNAVTTPSYTVDYQRGLVTFSADTNGTTYFVTARSYDLNGAAAEVWRKKMVHYHTAMNFETLNHRVDREALYKHAREMAEYFEGIGGEGMDTVAVMRSDTDAD